ncbi:dual specificity protein phosphatase family protein [Pseudomonadota bacterium]
MINYNQITAEIFVGSYPSNRLDVERLRSGLKITAVLNLQTDKDFIDWGINWKELSKIYLQTDMVVERVPIQDFDGVDLSARLIHAVDCLDRLITIGHRVYVHCTAGIGRAPATVVAYLAWCLDWSIDDAEAHLLKSRSCAPNMDAIRHADSERKTNQA